MTARRAIALVALREIRDRLRSRVFLASTVVMLGIVGASSLLPRLVDTTTHYDVAVASAAPHGLAAALDRAAQPFDATVRVRRLPAPDAQRALRADDVDAVLNLASDRVAFRSTVDAKLAAIADSAVRAVRRQLPPTPELTAVTVEPPKQESTDAEVLVATLGASVLLATIAIYGQWVLTGVVEEKQNRVVELILATVRPRDLLAGKVLGIGLLGLAQIALVGGLGAVLLAAGVFDAPASLGASLVLVVPWFALGFALYAVAYATAGAFASRAQDASSAGLPVTYTLIAAYFLGYVVVASDAGGPLAQVLTVFPLTAPLVLPARSALVGVPLWQHALALVLVIAAIVVLVRLAGRVYAAGLLRSGPRLGLRAALRISR